MTSKSNYSYKIMGIILPHPCKSSRMPLHPASFADRQCAMDTAIRIVLDS